MNSTQYSVINHMKRETEKEWRYIYIYIYIIHFAVYLKLTQLYKSIILQ